MAPNNTAQQPQNRPYPQRHSSFEHSLDAPQHSRYEHGRHGEDTDDENRDTTRYSHGVVASHFLAQPQNAPTGETWIDFLTNPTVPEPQPHPQSASSRYALPSRPPPRTDSSSSRSSDRKRRLTTAESPGRRRSSIRMHPENMGQNVGASSAHPIVLSSPSTSMSTRAAPPPPLPPLPPLPHMRSQRRESDLVLPPWQPDAEVSQCPVCGKAFTLFYRKHHCRKCGRVVCATCSPHRITIPRQFIVHPPNDPSSHIIDLTGDDDSAMSSFGPFRNPALGGGEEVRVCNPCVPDPNFSPPPQYPTAPPRYFPTQPHTTSRSPYGTTSQSLPRAHRSTSGVNDASRSGNHAQTSRQLDPPSDNRRVSYHGGTVSGERWLPPLPTASQPSGPYSSSTLRYTTPHHGALPFNMGPGSQSVINMFPRSAANSSSTHPIPSQPPPRPRRQIAEEDECPICGNELPPKGPDGDEDSRTQHIEECIALHSASPAPIPLTQQTSASLPNQRTRGMSNANAGEGASNPNRLSHAARGMFPFVATEKDCIDAEGNEEECIICFEEYEAGDKMARLVCWCKFHEKCIRDWWEKKGRGACPTHQLHE